MVTFRIIPIGELRDGYEIRIDPSEAIQPNSIYTALISVSKDLGVINKALGRITKNQIIGSEDYNPIEVVEELRFNFMSSEDEW